MLFCAYVSFAQFPLREIPPSCLHVDAWRGIESWVEAPHSALASEGGGGRAVFRLWCLARPEQFVFVLLGHPFLSFG